MCALVRIRKTRFRPHSPPHQALLVSEQSVQQYRWPASRLAQCTHVLKINPSFHLTLAKGSSVASWLCPADPPVVRTHCKGTTLMERWKGWLNSQGCLLLGKAISKGISLQPGIQKIKGDRSAEMHLLTGKAGQTSPLPGACRLAVCLSQKVHWAGQELRVTGLGLQMPEV